ncbi:hypothetical protein PHLGIDRAFT_114538 [Phlebiopsis gigantea 11061_1 CR5-6]|uniref:F-box domain-containing protein n=1 Tax=Phlebiopsis gigantea (strain 11061_1 CR5-6) TaxID=745531 RepID=A0A0C3S5R1_PHLG1|nr:hypothetical protein PHLGIDRAFT_114538 [Phlebiopsis gigantea 11061_1 CR5-6]
MEKQNLIHLAAMQNLKHMSIAIHAELSESPALPISPHDYVPFHNLETLMLDVSHLEHATSCLTVLEPQTLLRFRLAAPMWQDETALERCFKVLAKQRRLREISVCVSARAPGFIFAAGQRIPTCTMSTHTIAKLFSLPDIQILSLSAGDRAQFETDLGDTGIRAMASAWPRLRSLTIVQGPPPPRGVQLPAAHTTMGSLLALRDGCPDLSGLSISLDTTTFDHAILQAAVFAGVGGTALRKLNIGARSTPVSNHTFAAQVLHGLFPNLHSIHDGESVAWDQQSSDWQEVGAILRKLTQTPPLDPVDDSDGGFSDISSEEALEL